MWEVHVPTELADQISLDKTLAGRQAEHSEIQSRYGGF